jgi:hypothetical protein
LIALQQKSASSYEYLNIESTQQLELLHAAAGMAAGSTYAVRWQLYFPAAEHGSFSNSAVDEEHERGRMMKHGSADRFRIHSQ